MSPWIWPTRNPERFRLEVESLVALGTKADEVSANQWSSEKGYDHIARAIGFGKQSIPNYRRDEPPMTLLVREQKAWFKRTLASSQATWKVWGNEVALNRIWGISKNRSFLRNQAISYGLIFLCGVFALISAVLTALNCSSA